MVTALAAWGTLELTALNTTAVMWPGTPGGVRGEIAAATALGALGGWAVIASGAKVARSPRRLP